VKRFLKTLATTAPARYIGENWLNWIRRVKRPDSGVQELSLRPTPIAVDLPREYGVGMKSRSLNVRAELARVSVGRMFLHVACALKDGRVQWHWAGIKRELAEPCRIWRDR
jgi:hypothetical protein